MIRGAAWITMIGAVLTGSCTTSEPPPDPPILAQRAEELARKDPLRPSNVVALSVDHRGAFGPYPVYRVSISADGGFYYDGTSYVRPIGRRSGKILMEDYRDLLRWLDDHPQLYAQSLEIRHGNDLEQVVVKFTLRSGQEITLASDIGFQHDDLWVLLHLVDGIVGRAALFDRDAYKQPS